MHFITAAGLFATLSATVGASRIGNLYGAKSAPIGGFDVFADVRCNDFLQNEQIVRPHGPIEEGAKAIRLNYLEQGCRLIAMSSYSGDRVMVKSGDEGRCIRLEPETREWHVICLRNRGPQDDDY